MCSVWLIKYLATFWVKIIHSIHFKIILARDEEQVANNLLHHLLKKLLKVQGFPEVSQYNSKSYTVSTLLYIHK